MRRTHIDRVGKYYSDREDGLDDLLFDLRMAVQELPEDISLDMSQTKNRKRLLVVDDEENIRDNFYRLFSYHGYDVLTSGSAMEAKDILVREKVDIMFLDLNMPEVNGETLFEVARTFHGNIKIVISSVYPVEEQRERVKGADAYFDKAEARSNLLRLVSALS